MGQCQWSLVECRQYNNCTTIGQGNQSGSFNVGIFDAKVVVSFGILGVTTQIGIVLVINLRYMLHVFYYNQYLYMFHCHC